MIFVNLTNKSIVYDQEFAFGFAFGGELFVCCAE